MAFVFSIINKFIFTPNISKVKIVQLPFICDKTYNNKDFSINALEKAEYDNCTFSNCNFTNVYLANISFIECNFIDCNFTGTKIKNTTFNNITFKDCKLLGLPFYQCNPFLLSVSFNNCNLSLVQFNNLELKHTTFNKCNLTEADFTNTNLTKASFIDCDLTLAAFENSNLEHGDLRTSINYSIDPEKNQLRNTKFSRSNIEGLLKKHNIIIE